MSFRNYYDTSSYARSRADGGRTTHTSDRPTSVTAKYITPSYKTSSSIPVLCRDRSANRENESPISAIANRYANYNKTIKDEKTTTTKYGERKESSYNRLTVPGTTNSRSREHSPISNSSKYCLNRTSRAISPDRRSPKSLSIARSRDTSPKEKEKDIPTKTDKSSGYSSGYSSYKLYPRASSYARPISRSETKPEITLSRYGINNRLSSSYLRDNSVEKTLNSSVSPSNGLDLDSKYINENGKSDLGDDSVADRSTNHVETPKAVGNGLGVDEEVQEKTYTITVITRHTSPTPPGSSVYVRTRRADMAKTIEKTITRSNKRPPMVDKEMQSDRLDDSTRTGRYASTARASVGTWSTYTPSSSKYCGYAGRYSTQYANIRDNSSAVGNILTDKCDSNHSHSTSPVHTNANFQTESKHCEPLSVHNKNCENDNPEICTVYKQNEDDETSEIIINVNLKLKKAKSSQNTVKSADLVSPEVTITNCQLPPQAPKTENQTKIKKVKIKKINSDSSSESKKKVIKKRRGSSSSADSDQSSESKSNENVSPPKVIPRRLTQSGSRLSPPCNSDTQISTASPQKIIFKSKHSMKSQSSRESNSPDSSVTTSTQTSCSDDEVGSKSKYKESPPSSRSRDISRTSADETSIPSDKSVNYSPPPEQKTDQTTDEAKSFLIRTLAPVTSFFKLKQQDSAENSNWLDSKSESTSKDVPNLSTESDNTNNNKSVSTDFACNGNNKNFMRPIKHVDSGERAWWLESDNMDKTDESRTSSDMKAQPRKLRHIDSGERSGWEEYNDENKNNNNNNSSDYKQHQQSNNNHSSKYNNHDSEEAPWWLDSNANVPEGVERLSPPKKNSENENSEKYNFYKIRHIDSGEKEWWLSSNSDNMIKSNSRENHESQLTKSDSRNNVSLRRIRHVDSGERPWWLSSNKNVPEGIEKLPTPSPPPDSDTSDSDEVQIYNIHTKQIPPFPLTLPDDEPLGDRRSPEGLETPREDENYRHRRSPYENANYRSLGYNNHKEKLISRYSDIDDILGTSGQMCSPFMDSILARRTGQTQFSENMSDCEEIDPTQVRIHDSTPQRPVIKKLRCRSEIIDCRNEDQLDDAALQVYKDGDYGAYLDLDSTLGEQEELLEGLQDRTKEKMSVYNEKKTHLTCDADRIVCKRPVSQCEADTRSDRAQSKLAKTLTIPRTFRSSSESRTTANINKEEENHIERRWSFRWKTFSPKSAIKFDKLRRSSESNTEKRRSVLNTIQDWRIWERLPGDLLTASGKTEKDPTVEIATTATAVSVTRDIESWRESVSAENDMDTEIDTTPKMFVSSPFENEFRKNAIVLRTQLSVRVHTIMERLRSAEGRELRKALFTLKQILQSDKDLVHEFVTNKGLDCLMTVSASDQTYLDYILRALGQIMLYVDGMHGVMCHKDCIPWLYSLIASTFRHIVKTSLKLLLVFVEYTESNCLLLINAIRNVDVAEGNLPWHKVMKILKDFDASDTELLIYATTLINRCLNHAMDKDTYFDQVDALEEQGFDDIIQLYMSKQGTDLDLLRQFQIYEAVLSHEDGDETGTALKQLDDSIIHLIQRRRSDSDRRISKKRQLKEGKDGLQITKLPKDDVTINDSCINKIQITYPLKNNKENREKEKAIRRRRERYTRQSNHIMQQQELFNSSNGLNSSFINSYGIYNNSYNDSSSFNETSDIYKTKVIHDTSKDYNKSFNNSSIKSIDNLEPSDNIIYKSTNDNYKSNKDNYNIINGSYKSTDEILYDPSRDIYKRSPTKNYISNGVHNFKGINNVYKPNGDIYKTNGVNCNDDYKNVNDIHKAIAENYKNTKNCNDSYKNGNGEDEDNTYINKTMKSLNIVDELVNGNQRYTSGLQQRIYKGSLGHTINAKDALLVLRQKQLEATQETKEPNDKGIIINKEHSIKDIAQRLIIPTSPPISPDDESRVPEMTGLIMKAKEGLAKSQSKDVIKSPPAEVAIKVSENEMQWEDLRKSLKRNFHICDLDFSDLKDDDDSVSSSLVLGPGIPPPPPPGMLPPPPPNGGPASSLSEKKKTVKLFWKEVKENPYPMTMRGLIWDELPEVKIDTKILEHLFEAKKNDLIIKKLNEPKKNLILDAKRSNAINIGMKKLPTPQTIKAAIMKMDATVIGREGIEKLLTMLPTEEEKIKIQEAQYANPDLPLGSAEQFLLALASIAELPSRLKLWLFKLDFDNAEKEIAEPLMDLKQGIELLKMNKTFRAILSTLRTVGSFLNGTQVKGFRLEYLAKVMEVKDTVHKHPLLYHICEMIIQKFPDSSDFFSEVGPVIRASKVDFDALAQNLQRLEVDCKASWDHLKKVAKHDGPMVAKTKVNEFLTDAAERIILLGIIQKRVLNRFNNFLLFIGVPMSDVSTTKPTAFLKILAEFALEYMTSRERVLRQLEKKANHRERNKTRGKLIIDVGNFANMSGDVAADAALRELLMADGDSSSTVSRKKPPPQEKQITAQSTPDEIFQSMVMAPNKRRPIQRNRKRARLIDTVSLDRS